MNKLGIRAHDLGKDTATRLALKAKAFGFEGVQLVLKKALSEDIEIASKPDLPEAFVDVPIFMLGSYFNPVHPDQAIRQDGIDQFKAHLRIAKQWNVPYVGTETGSYLGSPWNYTPENHTEEALERVVDIVKDLVKTAETLGSVVAIEGAYAHVVYSPKRLKTLLDRVDSNALQVIVDFIIFLPSTITNNGWPFSTNALRCLATAL
jgi:L-ribulose-5-phosphate 3-epimerase